MIKVHHLFYSYDDQNMPVLKNIHMEIHEGEHVALIGPNGCGKTTLIKHLNALFSPGGGAVVVDGMDTRDHKNLKEIRCRVGMVFQNPDNQIVISPAISSLDEEFSTRYCTISSRSLIGC